MNWLQSVRTRGVVGTLKRFWKYDSVKNGRLVGQDKFGNMYFENKELPYGQHRWVEYQADDYDASQVTAEWHAWLHHMVDEDPVSQPPAPVVYQREHIPNTTGTKDAYHPQNIHIHAKESQLK